LLLRVRIIQLERDTAHTSFGEIVAALKSLAGVFASA